MFAASAIRTNAGIAARRGATPVATPNLHLVNSGLRLTIARLEAENDALRKRLTGYDAIARDADGIIQEMSSRYGIAPEIIRGSRGNRRVIVARHHAQYEIMRRCPAMPSTALAEMFGRDHSTILHALREWPKKAAALGIPCEPINLPVVKGYTPEAAHG